MVWRGPEAEVLPLCEELGIGFCAWSALDMGFLTGTIEEKSRFSAARVVAGRGHWQPCDAAWQSGGWPT
jgi:aryl-alcohol dehydrogenase-like predicted oxidoreductase